MEDPKPDLHLVMKEYGYQFSKPVTAGKHTIHVMNEGAQDHEAVMLKMAPGKHISDFNAWVMGNMQGPPPATTIDCMAGLATGRTGVFTADFTPGTYAIVCFVGDRPHLVQQALALRHSWVHAQSEDTDLVMMGPPAALAHIPNDVVKIEQRSVDDDPEWHAYRYADSVLCMNGAGAERLDRYTHVLRTDVDTFITPAWNDYRPSHFEFGRGGYSNDDDVRRRIRDIAARFGLTHRGVESVNSSWYGRTDVVRRASAVNAMLMKHIVTDEFRDGPGAWPGWYWGVSLLYAGEIAVNHCVPDARCSDQLDGSPTSQGPTSQFAHIHCWHTPEKFSKHAFMAGGYALADARGLDLDVARDFCMAMSFRSLGDLHPSLAPLVRAALESSEGRADATPAANRVHYRRSRV